MKTLFIATIILLMASVMPVFGQLSNRVCGARDQVVDLLSNKYFESIVGYGIRSGGGIAEIWVNTNRDVINRTFSIVVTEPTGRSCIVGDGNNWVIVVKPEA